MSLFSATSVAALVFVPVTRARVRLHGRPDERSAVRCCARPRAPSSAPIRRTRARVRARGRVRVRPDGRSPAKFDISVSMSVPVPVSTPVSVSAPAPAPMGVQPCAAALDRVIRLRPQFDIPVSVFAPVSVPMGV